MEAIVKLGLYEVVAQVVLIIPFIYIVDLFLDRQKLTIKKILLGLLVWAGLYAVLLQYFKDVSFYMIVNCIVVCCILYKGKTLHKSLCIVVAFGLNAISEMITQAFIDQFMRDYMPGKRGGKLILQLGSMILVLVFVIILKNKNFLRKNKRAYETMPKREIIALSILALFSIAIVCVGMFIYSGTIEGANNTVFLSIIMVGAVVLDLSLLVIIDHSVRVDYYKKLNQMIEEQLSKQLTYYERLEEVNQETRAIKHDMRNHMLVISDLVENGEADELKKYVAGITESAVTNERLIQTGNPIADAILNEKYHIARGQKINISADLQLSKEMNIEAADLCAILSNSIDNAIEACEKIEIEDNREIIITGRINHGYLIIQVMNKIQDEVIIRNNMIKTSKKDKKQHGYGLANIKESVAKYKGELNLSLKEHCFMLEVIINTSYV